MLDQGLTVEFASDDSELRTNFTLPQLFLFHILLFFFLFFKVNFRGNLMRNFSLTWFSMNLRWDVFILVAVMSWISRAGWNGW